MILTEYLTAMKELGGPIAIISVSLLCLALLVIIIKMLGGMRRGSWRQLIRTGVTLAAALVSYLSAVLVSNSIMGSASRQSIEDFITMADGYVPGSGNLLSMALADFNPEVFEYLIILPATIIMVPALATVIFLILNFILKIVRLVLTKIFGFKPVKANSKRLGGALLALVEAAIWIVMITLPITGIIGLADQAYTEAIASEEGQKNPELEETYKNYIAPFTENPAYLALNDLGVQSMADGIATIWIGDKKTNLRQEVLELAKIAMIEIPSLSEADFSALTEGDKLSIDNIISSFYSSPFLSSVAAGIIQSSSGLVNGELIPFDREGIYGSFFTGITDFLETVSADTLAADLSTIKNVYFIVSDSGVIKALENGGEDIMALLQEHRKNGGDSLVRIISVLEANPRSAGMITSLTRALIASMSVSVDQTNGASITTTYDSIKREMEYLLDIDREDYRTQAAYFNALRTAINNALISNGIILEGAIVDAMAVYADRELSDATELTDADFNALMLYYYNAYLDYVS